MSLIFDGVFDRFPTLRIVFVGTPSWVTADVADGRHLRSPQTVGGHQSANLAGTSKDHISSPPSRWTIPGQDRN